MVRLLNEGKWYTPEDCARMKNEFKKMIQDLKRRALKDFGVKLAGNVTNYSERNYGVSSKWDDAFHVTLKYGWTGRIYIQINMSDELCVIQADNSRGTYDPRVTEHSDDFKELLDFAYDYANNWMDTVLADYASKPHNDL